MFAMPKELCGLLEFTQMRLIPEMRDEDRTPTIPGNVELRGQGLGQLSQSGQVLELKVEEGAEMLGLWCEDRDADQIGIGNRLHGRFSLWGGFLYNLN